MLHMGAYLVCAARFEGTLNQRDIIKPAYHTVVCDGFLSMAAVDN